jgi:carbamoyl-phosphate synthase small subunit
MRGVLVSGAEPVPQETVETWLQASPSGHPVERVSTRHVQTWTSPVGQAKRRTVVVMDFGVKRSFVEGLLQAGCDVIQAPYTTDFATISSWSPDGVFLSNGPGDPRSLEQLLPTIASLVERYPLFGVGLGHQLLALACGGQVQKMRQGHRGTNYPVIDVETGKGWITAQHHGYEVVESSLADTALVVTHRLLHDGSVEGLRHKTYPAFSVQFHPDAHPGPTDTRFLLEEFVRMMDDQRGGKA